MRDQDRFRGCLIGGAAGDALGYAVEFLREGQIFRRYGECGITEYELTGGVAQISDDTQMSDREQCRTAYIEMYRAMIAKDIPALSTVQDDSFVLVHMTGMRQTKPAFLKAVENGTLNYVSAAHDSMEITIRR